MLVTVVITTHKRPPELVERAIQSVVAQTHKELEIIVVDDSPEDYENRAGVKKMVATYATKSVTYIAHGECMGACAARNTGLSVAKGEYIGFLDDDDEWMPEKIEEQLKEFVSEDVALVYCGRKTVYDETGEIVIKPLLCVCEDVYAKLMFENFIGSTSCPLLKTEALRSIGGFDVEMQSAQDYDVWLRIVQKYSIRYVNKPLVIYHFHRDEQITKNPTKKVAGLERIIMKNYDFLSKHREAYWTNYMGLVTWYIKAGKTGTAISAWLKAAFKQPFKILPNIKSLYALIKVWVVVNTR